MEERPAYYAIIPAEIRYDEELPDKAKLLYGEIVALSDKHGYCWATNNYFANLYGTSKRTISRLINLLAKKNYIRIEIICKEGNKEIDNRYISICPYPMEKNVHTPMEEIVHTPMDKNVHTPMDKNVHDNNINNNNTSINNTSNNNIIINTKDSIEYIDSNNTKHSKEYKDREINNNIYSGIIDYLNLKAGTHYRSNTNKVKSLIKARLNEGFELEDFKIVIDKKCREWLNTDMQKYLRPETLFGNKFDGYLNQKERGQSIIDNSTQFKEMIKKGLIQ